jgi:lipid-A-disaccharide synthase
LVFLVAGEPSGDALGARLMAALKTRTGGKIRFAGVGGDKMAAEGLVSLFPMREIAVMGLAEVVPRLFNIIARIGETVERAEHLNPDAVVTIDSPDFNFRVARRLKGLDFPLIHYVAPTVWAWRPGRARKIAGFLDRLMALLPFEPPYFEREGLKCDFVGHPVLESGAGKGDGRAFRARHGILPDAPVLCVLPGSRHSETRSLLPILGEAVARIARAMPGLRVVVPTLKPVAVEVRAAAVTWPGAIVVEGEEEKYDAFAASDAALAASGTVSLELAMAGVPHAVAYRMSPLTAWIARRLIRVRFVNLVNLVLDRAVVPELLQESCTAETLAEAGSKLLRDAPTRAAQKDAFAEALRRLGPSSSTPSERAAEVVLAAIPEYARVK